MKSLLIHGDDTHLSYLSLMSHLDKARRKSWEVIEITSESNNIINLLSTASLFNKQNLYLIKNIQIFKKNEFEMIIDKLKSKEGFSIFYCDTFLNPNKINQLPFIYKKEEYQIPKLIYKYLDSLYPGNTNKALYFLHKTLDQKPAEFIFACIIGHFKNLYLVKNIPQNLKLKDWQEVKLVNQSNRFSRKLLKKIFSEMSKIDISVKTSKTLLEPSLDQLIISNLE